MTSGDCPHCQHSRCIDCGVKSHAAPSSDTEVDAMKTPGTAINTENRMNAPSSSSQPRLHSNASLVITRVVDVENKSIFVLRNDVRQDKSLAAVWHDAIEGISSDCAVQCKTLSSIHLFRFGADEPTSQPTIIVNSEEVLTEGTMATLQFLIRQAIVRTCLNSHQGNGSLSDYLGIIQLLFRQSRLRRSGSSGSIQQLEQDLPPICEPRNRIFNALPQTGDSIGIHGSFVDTASLGCYLMVGSVVMALTVGHLLPAPSDDNPTTFSLTHLSKQDSRDLLVPILNAELLNILPTSAHTCELCAKITASASTAHLSAFSDHFLQFKELYQSCDIGIELNRATLPGQRMHRAEYIGSMKERSFQRCASSITPSFSLGRNREMDWALFRMFNDDHVSTLKSQHNRLFYQEPASLKVADVVSGARVKSLGRTSGHQRGQINGTESIVYHEKYVTYEWSVIKPPDMSVDDWVEGGIGVDGDSGALIVDEHTNEVYGMLWGRIGDDATTITLFTPITELLLDIEASMNESGTENITVLLRGQTMPAAPTTNPPTSDHDDDEVDVLGDEFSLVSLGQSAASSPTYRLPYQPERYRSHSPHDQLQPPDPERATPRRLQIQTAMSDPNLGPAPWLGSHTYFRYAVADEGE